MTYTIERVLGRGGFGITYLAVAKIKIGNINQEIRFAIKEHFVSSMCSRGDDTLRVEFSEPVAETVMTSRNAFITEARRLQHLGIEHPNIVHINEVFEANKTAYYVMEYLGDDSLKGYVEKWGKLSLEETAKIMAPVMEAVDTMHRNKLAHYDIKPGNIMLHLQSDKSVRPVLIDFGLAKHYDDDGQPTSQLNDSGYTAGYAPAQQYVGIKSFSPRCDVYALAATTFFCLTGQKPPEALSVRPENIIETLTPIVGNSVAKAVAHGMAMLEDDRTPDAHTLKVEIFGDCAPLETETPKPEPEIVPTLIQSKPQKTVKPCRRGVSPWVWIIICLALVGGGAAAYFLINKEQPDTESVAGTEAETETDIVDIETETQIEEPPVTEAAITVEEETTEPVSDTKPTVTASVPDKNTDQAKPEAAKPDVDESTPAEPRTIKCQPAKVNVSSAWIAPDYSTNLRAARPGSITFDVTFDKNGVPTNVKTVGSSTLDEVTQSECRAMVMVRRFTYKEGKSNIGGSARVTFHFIK